MMGTRIHAARKMVLPLWGASLVVLFALALLFSLFQPGPALAGSQDDELWFTVGFQEGGNFKVTGPLQGNFLMDLDPINVYKSGRAHAEYKNSGSSGSSGSYAESSSFEGRYDSNSKTLTGKYESSYSTSDSYGSGYSEKVTGTLEGTLKYRPDEVPDKPYIFTMRGTITCTGEAVTSSKDGESREPIRIDYDFVANGNTGGEKPAGEEAGKASGGGNKIPGPGSWWEWLTGTVVAGAVAAGTGLVNLLFGSTPPPPVAPTAPPRPPYVPPADAPRIGPAGVFHSEPPGLAEDVAKKMREGAEIASFFSQNVLDDVKRFPKEISNLWDSAKKTAGWVYSGVTDPENIKDSFHRLEEWNRQRVEGDKQYLDDVMHDPTKPLKDMGEAQRDMIESAAKYLKENPLGILKTLLSADLWEKAMDWRRPLLERFGYSAIATLNTIGLIEGVSGLKGWLFEGGEKKALGEGLEGLVAGSGEKKAVGEGLTGKVPKLEVKKGYFDELGKADKGKLKTVWANESNKARSKVESFKKAMKSGDMQERAKAVLEIQKDPLAIQNLNVRDKSVIKSFNKQLAGTHEEASLYTREQIAAEKGIDASNVEFFNATNPKAPGVKVKAGMDKDLTPRYKDKNGMWQDYDADNAQKLYDDGFYQAAGSPKGTNATQLGKDCRNVAVDRHSAEAFGMSPDDWDQMQLGKAASHTDTVARTMEYKANEAFTKADNLAKNGYVKEAMKERWLGQRETVKAYKNQVEGRVEYLERHASPEKMAVVNKKIASVDKTIRKMDDMIKSGSSPVQIDDFLKSQHTTAEDLAKQVADIYRGFTP